MTWTPRYAHVTQWGSAGDPRSGGNNCAEASIARALLEYDADSHWRAADPEWALVRAVHAGTATVLALMDRISVLARGAHIGPWDGFTSAEGIQRALSAFGLDWTVLYTGGASGAAGVIEAARQSAVALLWVNGAMLAPSSYGGAYFGGDWGYDHIILSLPDGNLCNDPLTDVPNRASDVRYDWGALQAAIGGAWLLPAPEATPARAFRLIAPASLKAYPNHLGAPTNCTRLQLPQGALVTARAGQTPHWCEVISGRVAGWLVRANLEPVS